LIIDQEIHKSPIPQINIKILSFIVVLFTNSVFKKFKMSNYLRLLSIGFLVIL
jgi:hypothetical protein